MELLSHCFQHGVDAVQAAVGPGHQQQQHQQQQQQQPHAEQQPQQELQAPVEQAADHEAGTVDQPPCASAEDRPYNFGPASGQHTLLFASARPGARRQRCYDKEDIVKDEEVHEWVDFMVANGIWNAVGLLTRSELATYESDLVHTLRERGVHSKVFDPKEGGLSEGQLAEGVVHALAEAEGGGEKCVVFDWGGGSRACKLLAVYLVRQHHYDAEVAIDDVCSASPGVNRRVDLKQVQAMCPACAEEAV